MDPKSNHSTNLQQSEWESGTQKKDIKKSKGKKFDQEKPRLDLLASKALLEMSKLMTKGADKYGSQNWRQGLEWSRVFAAVQRHLLAWNDGETDDPETGINHLAHAGCGIMFLLEYSKTHGELDDRYKGD